MYASVPSSSRACGGLPDVSSAGGRSQRTGPRPPSSDGGAVMWQPGPSARRSRSASSQPIRYSSCGSSAAAPGATKNWARPDGVTATGPSGSPIRSSRTSARRPAGSATSRTSNVRPTGSSIDAPGTSAHALARPSSSVAPAGTSSAKSSGCAPGDGAAVVAARAAAGRGPRSRRDGPAPQPGVLGHRGALGRTAAAPCAGSHLTDAADREAHAPSNGSGSPVVTTRSAVVTFRRPVDRAAHA